MPATMHDSGPNGTNPCNAEGLKRVDFLGTKLDLARFDDICVFVDEHAETREPAYMVSMNVDSCVKVDADESFRRAFESAGLILMDSTPLMRVAEQRGLHVPEKLSGSDLMPRICSYAASKGYSCFILGGKEGVPDRAAENLRAAFPELRIAGTLSPEFGFEKDGEALEEAIAVVRGSHADILFCCLGMPKAEYLLYERVDDMGIPASFSVGAAVDFAAGNVRRAPKWMQRAGLEWFYRFCKEPKRLFRRYFIESWSLLGIMMRMKENR